MSANLAAIAGGDGLPAEPVWAELYADELDIVLAGEEWGFVTRELQAVAGLSVANGNAIKRLVQFRVQFDRAAKHVAEHGAILAPTSRKSKTGQWNPYWSVMRQADEAIRALEAELGIPPVRRSKIAKVIKTARKARPSDAYLGAPRS